MSKKKKSNEKRKRKLSFKKISFFLLTVIFIILILNVKITNIYISGNKYLSDQEIIDILNLSNYPKSITNYSYKLENKLEENVYIYKANVRKNIFLNKVYIELEENYPLFYNSSLDKTILYNGKKVDDKISSVTLINSIPENIYDEFLKKIRKLDINILNRISEIEYSPNDILIERFLLYMNDGNYVYITLDKFLTLNKYLNIIKSFDDKKGILYLDSGEYFEIFDK